MFLSFFGFIFETKACGFMLGFSNAALGFNLPVSASTALWASGVSSTTCKRKDDAQSTTCNKIQNQRTAIFVGRWNSRHIFLRSCGQLNRLWIGRNICCFYHGCSRRRHHRFIWKHKPLVKSCKKCDLQNVLWNIPCISSLERSVTTPVWCSAVCSGDVVPARLGNASNVGDVGWIDFSGQVIDSIGLFWVSGFTSTSKNKRMS